MGRFQKPILLSVLAAIGLYFGAMFVSDFNATKNAMADVGLVGWAVVLSLSLVNYGLRYWRWEWYLTSLSRTKLPHGQHLAYYLCGFALSTTPGKAGETVRSLYLKRHDISYSNTISTFFVERFQDMLSILMLASLATLLFDGYSLVVWLTALLVVSILPMMHSTWALNFAESFSKKFPEKITKITGHLLELVRSSALLLKNRELVGGMIIGLIAWLAEGIGFWYLLTLLDQDVGMMAAVGIYGLSVLIGAISFLPGGLGSTEAVMGLLLISLGVPEPLAIAATLICRIATLWFAVFIGLITAGVLASKGITPIVQNNVSE